MSNNLHSDHRKRVRSRFIRDGNLDSFEQHQVLEFLLFYAIPRRDTNELAHKMLKEYGSLYNLMNAKPEDIMKRCKVSEVTAVLISSIPHISRKFLNSAWTGQKIVLDNFNKASKYMESILLGQPYESFYILCLDSNKVLKKAVRISDGGTDSAPVYMEKVVSDALLYNSSYIIIGHNHPGGMMKPSAADLDVTQRIISAFNPLGIVVIDHIIVCGTGNFSFAMKGLCHMKY